MRTLDSRVEASIHSVPHKARRKYSKVMEYSDGAGKKEGKPPQRQYYSIASSSAAQEARQQQPQHRLPPAAQQQQQPPWSQQQQQPQQFAQQQQQQPPSYASYPQQDMMTATLPVMEPPGDYLSAQQAAAQAQYMHSPPYASAATAGGYGAAPPTQYPHQPPPPIGYSQQLAMQQSMMGAPPPPPPQQPIYAMDQSPHLPPSQQAALQQPYIQPRIGRLPADRPLVKLSISLIDTYKQINTVYYEERDARRAARAKEKSKKGQGTNNNGWDDEHYDYIITTGELFYGRYRIKERIGKGSFGQVVRAEDTQEGKDVAIKIIKSKKPFLMQAKTEIDLLTHLNEKDADDQHNIVRLTTHFMYRNHQCLVFEMLSLNLYELLKNTQFGGVSLNLIRKFSKQVLKSLSFLARDDVDIIHCDLKPENILLRHPKKSGIKVIDFGSSCRSNKRMYSYIQSRFYRSPEVMLGLPYSTAIDMWSLGCILAEMHTGEPLFSGSDQFDQMQKIVKLLGMVPSNMLDEANETTRQQFFERARNPQTGREEWAIKQQNPGSSRGGSGSSQQPPQQQQPQKVVVPSKDPIASIAEVIRAETSRKKKYPPSETGNSARNYELFVDLIHRMLSFDPKKRISPADALSHPFVLSVDHDSSRR